MIDLRANNFLCLGSHQIGIAPPVLPMKRIFRSHPQKMSLLCQKMIDSKSNDISKSDDFINDIFWNSSMTNDGFQKQKVVPTTRKMITLLCNFLDLDLSKTLIDSKGPRQRCLCLHQFTTFIFCLTKKRNHTVHAVLSDLMKLQDCCLPWPRKHLSFKCGDTAIHGINMVRWTLEPKLMGKIFMSSTKILPKILDYSSVELGLRLWRLWVIFFFSNKKYNLH